MLDECDHPAEGGLEGREPIGRLFRDIEENLRDIRDSLLLCWSSSGEGGDLMEGSESAHIDFDPNYSQQSQVPSR